MENEIEPLITFADALKYLNSLMPISRSYLYSLCASEKIPHLQPGGGKILFRKSELNAWIEKSRVGKSATEIGQAE